MHLPFFIHLRFFNINANGDDWLLGHLTDHGRISKEDLDPFMERDHMDDEETIRSCISYTMEMRAVWMVTSFILNLTKIKNFDQRPNKCLFLN